MYEELIKRLRECTAEQNGEKTLWHQAADAIEELQKQLREEKVDNVNLTGWLAEEHAMHLWIPVTERLPEEYEYVLCKTDYGMEVGYHRNEWGQDEWTTGKFASGSFDISHWMPLPSTEGLNGG